MIQITWVNDIRVFVGKSQQAQIVKTNPTLTTASKNLRHCMVVHAHYPFGETRVEREARSLVDHGYEVDVISLGGKSESRHEIVDGINIYRLPVMRHLKIGLIAQLLEYFAFFALATFKLTALNIQRRYNVVQVHNIPDWLVFVALIPKLTGTRVILDLHDLMPEFYAGRFNRSLNSWAVRLLIWQERISCWFADHVITVTELWRDTLIRRGLPPAKVSVVMNLADNKFFFRTSTLQNVYRKDMSFHLLYHGNLTYRYGIDLVIRAIGLLRREIPDIHLTVHGWGDYRRSLVELTDNLDLNNQVSFSTAPVPTSGLPQIIRQADVCVVPYRQDVFTDGILPTKLMEYAALAMPVIVARTLTIATYFDESMVQFFAPGDVEDLACCIRVLYADRNRLNQLKHGIDRFNQQYSWAIQSLDYVSLVQRLAQFNAASRVEPTHSSSLV